MVSLELPRNSAGIPSDVLHDVVTDEGRSWRECLILSRQLCEARKDNMVNAKGEGAR